MSRSNPLPVSLQQECRKACKIFASFADPVNGLDHIIPPSILRKAKGFAFITIVKAGFVFSARAGTGVVIARLKDGSWSAPSAIGTAGVGAGFQAGAEITEFMIILNSSAAVKSFMAKGSLTVGGNMSISAGPLGRNVEGTGTLSAKGGVSAMYSYSRSKGLFGGASIEGSIIVERSDANSKAYGFNVTAKQLLSGSVDVPPWAEQLGQTIKARSGKDNRIPGWIEDGAEIEREYDSDDDEGGTREVFRDDGLTPKEYGQRGYSFGSQYASGGSHQTKKQLEQRESTSQSTSPTRDRSGSQGSGRFGGMLGSLSGAGGRSRSGSGASNSFTKSTSSRQEGPVSGDAYNFDTKFESDFDDSQSRSPRFPASQQRGAGGSGLSSPTLSKKDFSLIDAQDPFSEAQSAIEPSNVKPASRPGLLSRVSSSSVTSKLTKSKSSTGNGGAAAQNGLRERVGQMNWSTFDNASDHKDPARDSFDSLDDDDNEAYSTGRKRATTISSSNPSDTMSSYHRPPLVSRSSGGRNRSFTSPFGSSSPFSRNKNKKGESTAYNDQRRNENNGNDLYPIRSNDSNNSDYEFNEPAYAKKATAATGRARGNSNPQPWDSEDENFLQESTRSARPEPPRGAAEGGRGGAFDLRQVEADFASVADGNGLSSYTGAGGSRSRSSTITATPRDGGRSRSGTVTSAATTSSAGAIGTAIAKYDFRGVEATDLPFSKNDVLVILDKDDEEWWRARLKLREGMIPRNYIGEIEWF
ncbi:uncharacterized protein JCM15063_000173 [Sporobolomyces koalae]|uniref:uncharacterized protein n=1 Tax=Sporobolomyces koalae TaxID=500713 RepID=UPI00317901D2